MTDPQHSTTTPPSRHSTEAQAIAAAERVRAQRQARAAERPAVVQPVEVQQTFDGRCLRCSQPFTYRRFAIRLGERWHPVTGPVTQCDNPACAAAAAAERAVTEAADAAASHAADLERRRMAYTEWVPPRYHSRAVLAPASLQHLVPELASWTPDQSLYLYGPPSSGKSHQLACLMHRVAGRVSMEWYSTRDLMAATYASMRDKSVERPSIFAHPTRPKVLVFNDLFAERATGFSVAELGNVVDARYDAGLPINVTANVAPSQIPKLVDPNAKDAAAITMELQRIAERILEMSSAPHGMRLELADTNWRHAIAERGLAQPDGDA